MSIVVLVALILVLVGILAAAGLVISAVASRRTRN
jgi:Tfp pilus assembly protein PilV